MRRQHRGFKLLALLFGFTLVIAACGDSDEDPGTASSTTEEAGGTQEGGTVILAAEQEPINLNSSAGLGGANSAWAAYVMSEVWPSTVFADHTGGIVENEELVTSIELTNEDPQTIEYTINPDAVWEDDVPITADDFEFTWFTQNGHPGTEPDPDNPGEFLPEFDAAATNGYDVIESVTGSDEGKTVTVVFSEPYADWKVLFSGVLPKHGFEAAGGGDAVEGWTTGFSNENPDAVDNVISGGPYDVSELTAGVGMTLVRNENYYGEPAALDSIEIPYLTDASQQPAAVENGEADVIFPQAQLDIVQQMKNVADATTFIGFGVFWEHMDLNVSNKFLADVNVRKAIAQGIDRADIVEKLPKQFDEKAEVLNNRIFFPGGEYYEDHSGDFGAQDVAAAGAFLEESGFAKGSDGIYAKDGEKLSIRFTWREPNERRASTAQLVQSQLKEVGIDIVLAPQPDFAFLDSGDFDIALFGWTGGAALGSNESIYRSDGGQNHSGLAIPEVDSLLDEQKSQFDPDERAASWNAIDEALWDGMPTIPLFQVPEMLAWRTTIDGPEYNGVLGPNWNASKWSLAI